MLEHQCMLCPVHPSSDGIACVLLQVKNLIKAGTVSSDLKPSDLYVEADHSKCLNRKEFTFALVLYAICRYVRNKQIRDVRDGASHAMPHSVHRSPNRSAFSAQCTTEIAARRAAVLLQVSDALTRFLEVDLLGGKGGELLTAPNSFRSAHCYHEATTKVLVEHEKSLRLFFGAMAALPDSKRGAPSGKTLAATGPVIDLARWLEFVRAMGFISDDVRDKGRARAMRTPRADAVHGVHARCCARQCTTQAIAHGARVHR